MAQTHGAVVDGEGEAMAVNCKDSVAALFVPEKDDAVAHGDANLSAADFLATF
jgi:hypothetical protein